MQDVSICGRKKWLVKYAQNISVVFIFFVFYFMIKNNKDKHGIKSILKEATWP